MIAVVMVLVVSSMGAVYLTHTSSIARREASLLEDLKAFYVAEAGLAEAFQAVRIGRTGQLGSATAPATFGDGLVWVDASVSTSNQVHLESTALVGAGRATIALVVEPVDIPLGFFSHEALVVENTLVTDGFDSDLGTYQEQTQEGILSEPMPQELVDILGASDGCEYTIGHHVGIHNFCEGYYEHADWKPIYILSQLYLDMLWGDIDRAYSTYERNASGTGEPLYPYPDPGASGGLTPGGGLLSSNGDVEFRLASGESATVMGDVMPGQGYSVLGSGMSISGDTDARSYTVELPEVRVPEATLQPAVVHSDLLPMLVSPGTTGYESITVKAGAELVVVGPAELVVGTMTLEAGSLLILDTRNGDVALYVTQGDLDFQPGSTVATSQDDSDELSIQVGSGTSTPIVSNVNLDAASQFYGTIYAPESPVNVGSDFEIYGGVVARQLTLAPGARLHFDNAGYENDALPQFVAWEVLDIPEPARRRTDPYALFDLTPGTATSLADSNDLENVVLEIQYYSGAGGLRTYSGPENEFDWSQVSSVESVSRQASRPPYAGPTNSAEVDAQSEGGTPSQDPGTETNPESAPWTAETAGLFLEGSYFVATLEPMVPPTAEERGRADPILADAADANFQLLQDAGLAAGGTGGPRP